ncbi:hypothetical protein BO71DRAFT_421023 [Aspergillus ellipticus CBS 707.79]|uniref:Zn(2)-C6 fungal-type domain-containing protein n=1 Tax=Aspergillus ellipticus CBS 707.79 TaxID=1448320 RepID=A0A319DCY4_9EURO|nr:hypothetical protein BO71DRAFT_421023 [Aspergillus ellipticus CBS 707.79]
MASPAPRQKRRRAPLACSTCRHRKSRCTSERPCSTCRELQTECLYPADGSSNNLTGEKKYYHIIPSFHGHCINRFRNFLQMEKRLAGIEKKVQQLWQAQVPVTSRAIDSHPADGVAQDHQPDTMSELREIDSSENEVDGMGAMNFTDEEEYGFFGPSSNIAFMRYLSRAIAKAKSTSMSRVATPPSMQKRDGMVSLVQSQAPVVSRELIAEDSMPLRHVNIYALPSEDRTRMLIKQYFEKTGQLLPFIHEMSFCETYLHMRLKGLSKVRRNWLGLLNIILAISTSLSMKDELTPEERIQESDMYYQRANSLCDRDSKCNASLEMVQYLLLLGQYLQGTQKSIQAWTTHGLAISAAYQIEIKMLSSGPESSSSSQLDGAFFTAAIKLYDILYRVLNSYYGNNLGLQNSLRTADSIAHILDEQRQLNKWRTQLVPSLGLHIYERLMTPEDVKDMNPQHIIRYRFDIVLSVRYHNLRILLHRPRLESLLEALWLPSDMLAEDKRIFMSMDVASVHSCLESASSIITIVHSITTSTIRHHEVLGAWNYSLYYTFNAALVIAGCMVVAWKDRDDSPSTWEPLETSRGYIEKAILALRRLDSGNRIIARCVEYLSHLVLVLDTLSKLMVPFGIGGDSFIQLRW